MSEERELIEQTLQELQEDRAGAKADLKEVLAGYNEAVHNKSPEEIQIVEEEIEALKDEITTLDEEISQLEEELALCERQEASEND